MGRPRIADDALLFAGLLYRDDAEYYESLKRLISKFGPAALISAPMAWVCSDHYSAEMGSPLTRRFVFFSRLVPPDSLADIKLAANEIEQEFSTDGKRCVNIDPGYLTLAKIVLASTKEYSHRIYIGKGIFAETTLVYEKKGFIPIIKTYNDYKDEKYHALFMLGRQLLKLVSSPAHAITISYNDSAS